MIILAVYYTFADIVLLIQCFWYKGFTLRDEVNMKKPEEAREVENGNGHTATEQSPLIPSTSNGHATIHSNGHAAIHSNGNGRPTISDIDRRASSHSQSSLRERLMSLDASHLNPVTPWLPDSEYSERPQPQSRPPTSQTTIQAILFNLGAIILVCASGVFGWYLSEIRKPPADVPHIPETKAPIEFNRWGQIFGYICAFLYLGSRIPQLLLNYRRKSTEGISMLFFLFACIGNFTYVLSIVAYKPSCSGSMNCGGGDAAKDYWKYIAVNASWLLGSFGTLLLDAFVFIQYFLYRVDGDEEEEEEA